MGTIDLDGVFPEDRPYEPPDHQPYTLLIAGFWRRLLAHAIDQIILAIFFFLLALFFPSYFFILGPKGRLISFAIGTAYFTYYHSRAGHGQTPGKRALKIIVTDAQGQFLSYKKAFWRAGLLSTILWFNDLSLPIFASSPVVGTVTGAVFIGGLFSLYYGCIFNRATRQGPHDILVGSYVVESLTDYSKYTAPIRPRRHEIVMAGLFWIGAMAGLVIQIINPLGDLSRALSRDDRFFGVQVVRRNNHLLVEGWYPKECATESCDEMIADLAEVVLTEYEDIDQISVLEINIVNSADLTSYGFYVDIITGTRSTRDRLVRSLKAPPDSWRAEVANRLLARGNNYYQQEDYPAAIDAYTRITNVAPTFASAYYNRGLAYRAQGNYRQALADFRQYQQLANNNPSADWLIEELERLAGESGSD